MWSQCLRNVRRHFPRDIAGALSEEEGKKKQKRNPPKDKYFPRLARGARFSPVSVQIGMVANGARQRIAYSAIVQEKLRNSSEKT